MLALHVLGSLNTHTTYFQAQPFPPKQRRCKMQSKFSTVELNALFPSEVQPNSFTLGKHIACSGCNKRRPSAPAASPPTTAPSSPAGVDGDTIDSPVAVLPPAVNAPNTTPGGIPVEAEVPSVISDCGVVKGAADPHLCGPCFDGALG